VAPALDRQRFDAGQHAVALDAEVDADSDRLDLDVDHQPLDPGWQQHGQVVLTLQLQTRDHDFGLMQPREFFWLTEQLSSLDKAPVNSPLQGGFGLVAGHRRLAAAA